MGIRLSVPGLVVLSVIAAAVMGVVERFLHSGPGGSLLLTMVFWRALAEGCVAVVAAAEVCHGKWHRPLMKRLLSAYAFIPVIGAFFLVQWAQLDMYPWIHDHGMWLNKPFFLGRHLVVLAIVFLVARKFATEALRGNDRRRLWGVVYLFLFMISQTMVGIEWVMSLEKPWTSTLFGAWFMVSAFQSGIAVAAISLFLWRQRFDDGLRYAQLSIGGLLFAFAIFWAYFYFSQLIVIWYGNLPEETGFLARRIGYHTPYWAVARLIFGLCWAIPFSVLLGKKPKVMPGITFAMALTILTGFLLEKWLMIHPAVAVSPVAAALDMLVAGFVFISVMKSGDALLPGGGAMRPVEVMAEAHT